MDKILPFELFEGSGSGDPLKGVGRLSPESKNYISDCMGELDLIDNLPFFYKIQQRANAMGHKLYVRTAIEFYINGEDYANKKYFKIEDYNKYILPIVRRILKDDSIFISEIEVGFPLFNRIEHLGSLINRSNGEFIMGPKQSVTGSIDSPLHDVSIIFN